MLGTEVGIVIQVFGFLEHVFPENTAIQTSSGNRTGVMETTGLDRGRAFNGMFGAINVGDLLRWPISAEIVNSGKMKKMQNFFGS